MANKKFDVTGMTCSACSAHVEKNVGKLEGVSDVNVNLLSNSMTVKFNEENLNENDIIKAVTDAGYQAALHGSAEKSAKAGVPKDAAKAEIEEMKSRLILSILFTVPLFYISMGHMFSWPLPSIFLGTQNALVFAFTQFLLVIPVALVNSKYYRVGYKTLFKGSPNMDSLIAIGSSAALIYGIFAIYKIGYGLGYQDIDLVMQYSMDLYFESAAMILTLITLGKFLEARAKGQTSQAITKLINLAPKTALVVRQGKEIEISAEALEKGDVVVIKPGWSVPADGIILKGSSFVDESALTGESIPVEKKEGDGVISASINQSGYFTFRAEKVGEDTTLSQIIRLVEEASSSKAPISKLADKISGVFVPVVIGIAFVAAVIWLILGYSFEFAFSIGITVLVISCPCALGLATPTAVMVGTGKGAENGILIKTAESLEIAHTINTVVLDKTGTITEGKPKITDMITDQEITKDELLRVAASLETSSEHPLAAAIVNEAKLNNLELFPVDDFQAVPGQGIFGTVNQQKVFGGNLAYILKNKIDQNGFDVYGKRFSEEGKTPLYFSNEKRVFGVIAVADVVKPSSVGAIKAFEAMGIEAIMLTGDNQKTAAAIGKQIAISRVIAEVMPQDKEREIKKLQNEGKKVAMIGDGINDAPALVRADVGIAIGAGADIAIESADIVLVKSSLYDAVSAIQLSHAVIRNIKQNLFWALFYNSLGIPLAAGVFYLALGWKLNPMFGAAAMSLSSVFVVTNALRLKLFKPVYGEENTNEEMITKKFNDTNQMNQNKGGNDMKKKMFIEGMSCGHCSARVEKALNDMEGVVATVDLAQKTATIQLSKDVGDEQLKKAVEDAGYSVSEIKNQ